jgi:exodeoxyribonuclease VII large subunit
MASPSWIVDSRAEELTRFVARGAELALRIVDSEATRIGQLRSHLRALSPQGTLDRGYAIVQLPTGAVARTPDQTPSGAQLAITLAEGRIAAVSSGPSR